MTEVQRRFTAFIAALICVAGLVTTLATTEPTPQQRIEWQSGVGEL